MANLLFQHIGAVLYSLGTFLETSVSDQDWV